MTKREALRAASHLHRALHPDLRALRTAIQEANGLNAKLAVFVTNVVGTMWCAYLFTCISVLGLPAALRPNGEGIVAWIAQTFLQLVLLSVIMVGQNVQSLAADARAENTFHDTEQIIDLLNIHTEGGLKAILDRLDGLERKLGTPNATAP